MNMFNILLVLLTSYFIFLETSEGFLSIFRLKTAPYCMIGTRRKWNSVLSKTIINNMYELSVGNTSHEPKLNEISIIKLWG